MGEECRDCGKPLIRGYTPHGEPLCNQHFEEYVEAVLADAPAGGIPWTDVAIVNLVGESEEADCE